MEVDSKVAVKSALTRHAPRVPLADSLIAATAALLRVPVYTDDPHFRSIAGLVVRWIG